MAPEFQRDAFLHMSLKAKLEAIIYAAEEPVTLAQLTALFAGEAMELKADQEAAAAKAREAVALSSAAGAAQPPLNEAFEYLELEAPVHDQAASAAVEAEGERDRNRAGVEPGVEPSTSLAASSGTAASEPPHQSIGVISGEPGVETGAIVTEEAASGQSSAEPAEEAGTGDETAIEAEAKRLAKLRDREARVVIRQLLDELIAEYAADGRGIEIREIAGGYRMATKLECHDAVRSFVKSQKPPLKLSMPALETLAVIAYKQPVTAPEVNDIRGVDSSGVFGSLLARKLITTAGRKPVVGRPILYKTTREFLLRFGLKDVSELPSMEEFEKLAASELEEPEVEAGAEAAASAAEEFNPDMSVEQNEPAPEAKSESNPEGSAQTGESAPGHTE
jgi:segregation and condensation protein B